MHFSLQALDCSLKLHKLERVHSHNQQQPYPLQGLLANSSNNKVASLVEHYSGNNKTLHQNRAYLHNTTYLVKLISNNNNNNSSKVTHLGKLALDYLAHSRLEVPRQ